MTPTARSLAHLRGEGHLVDVVERWNPHTRTRHDLFNIGDLLAVHPEHGVTVVQVTSGSNVAARVRKIADAPATPLLRAAGVGIVVHGWRKNAKGRWELREVDCS